MNCVYCIWNRDGKTPCTRAANHIIIYGCLDQHLTEYPYCWEHATIWEEYFNKRIIVCSHINDDTPLKTCDRIIAEWDFVEI
jgi:hypothetical protein